MEDETKQSDEERGRCHNCGRPMYADSPVRQPVCPQDVRARSRAGLLHAAEIACQALYQSHREGEDWGNGDATGREIVSAVKRLFLSPHTPADIAESFFLAAGQVLSEEAAAGGGA